MPAGESIIKLSQDVNVYAWFHASDRHPIQGVYLAVCQITTDQDKGVTKDDWLNEWTNV